MSMHGIMGYLDQSSWNSGNNSHQPDR